MGRLNTYEKLIDKYLECVRVHSNIDYADMKSVRRGNRAVHTMMKIVETIREKHRDRVEDFSQLLSHQGRWPVRLSGIAQCKGVLCAWRRRLLS